VRVIGLLLDNDAALLAKELSNDAFLAQ